MSSEIGEKKQKRRRPFTEGWTESLEVTDSLPIKEGGKIIRTFMPIPTPSKNVTSDENIIIHDESDEENTQNKTEEKKSRQPSGPSVKYMLEINPNLASTEDEKGALQENIANICTLILANPEEAFSHRKKTKGSDNDDEEEEIKSKKEKKEDYHIEDLLKLSSSSNPYEVEIALLSTAVLFKDICPSYRIRHVNTESDNSQLTVNNNKSGHPMKKETRKLMQYEKLLVKYYHDFLMILSKRVEWAFQLQQSASLSLYNNGDKKSWRKYEKIRKYLGYVAFKAQIELLKSLSGFNYRSVLLSSILQQAMTFFDYHSKYAQKSVKGEALSHPAACFTLPFTTSMIEMIMSLTIEGLSYLIQHDTDRDLTFELVTTFNRCIKQVKYNISYYLLKIFEHIPFHVHMNDKLKIQHQKKLTKKQLKSKINDINREVDIGLLEANANGNEINKKAYEIQILQELCLIYFRILKMKIGYHLLPMALEGLSRITHLINIETVKDLILVLKSFLFQEHEEGEKHRGHSALLNPHTPYEVKLLSLHCILKTLIIYAGKEILQVDDEPYLLMFKLLIKKFPDPSTLSDAAVPEDSGDHDNKPEVNSLEGHQTYSLRYYWKTILFIVDLLFVQKHHEQNAYVLAIVQLLLGVISKQIMYNQISDTIGLPVLTYLHNVVLRYPRIRPDLQKIVQEKLQTPVEGQTDNDIDDDDEEVGKDNSKSKKRKKKSKNHPPVLFTEDDKVEDLAMKGLQELDYQQHNLLRYRNDREDLIGSNLRLLKDHPERRYGKLIQEMLAKDFHPHPFNWKDLEDRNPDGNMKNEVTVDESGNQKSQSNGKKSFKSNFNRKRKQPMNQNNPDNRGRKRVKK